MCGKVGQDKKCTEEVRRDQQPLGKILLHLELCVSYRLSSLSQHNTVFRNIGKCIACFDIFQNDMTILTFHPSSGCRSLW